MVQRKLVVVWVVRGGYSLGELGGWRNESIEPLLKVVMGRAALDLGGIWRKFCTGSCDEAAVVEGAAAESSSRAWCVSSKMRCACDEISSQSNARYSGSGVERGGTASMVAGTRFEGTNTIAHRVANESRGGRDTREIRERYERCRGERKIDQVWVARESRTQSPIPRFQEY